MNIDIEKIAAEQAPRVAKELLTAAKRGGTEADFRREAARIIEQACAAAELIIIPRDEFSVARGRVDSVYNRLILEYKRPTAIRETNEGQTNQKTIEQVKDYIKDVAKKERREAQRLAGVALDGFYFIFVRKIGEGWSVDEPMPVNAASTELFLRLLFSLAHGVALVPENLVEDFGPRTLRAQRAVKALYTALHGSKHPLVLKLFEQWRLFFSEATDYKEWAEQIESKEEFRNFVKGMGLDPRYVEAPKVFFALHTYYALLIKLVASLAAARFAGGTSAPLAAMAGKEGMKLKEAFINLERGGLFREYGIRNFLEGDFFGWYLAAWDDDIEEANGKLVQRLAEYDPGTLELAPENARDLLKKLYHYLLPREIRHDLGEYYTPDWLAEHVIRQTLEKKDLGDPNKRVLDPACGSGTFLVILIKFIKQRVAERKIKPAEALELTLRNVIGFDLNPLAVIAARTNYLLALGDLLKSRKGDIDIPVYQADSVLTPSQGTDLFTGGVYPLKTSVGEFRVPAVFAERERMDALTNALDESVEVGVGEDVFLTLLAKALHMPAKEWAEAERELKCLYCQLRELHKQGLNGVWARIIKNAFAPLFIEPCDYVVGNPPWVNWENLPDEYRRSSMPLWDYYGLFPKREKAMHTILGSAKYDISMLMTYVALDRYLLRKGKLGFVLSQSLFKSSAAGQGFRRFQLPDNVSFAPLVVDDMVELKPFEKATNRTVVGVFARGYSVNYPVLYPHWKKRLSGRGSAIGFDTPYEEVISEKVSIHIWHAEPVDKKDSTSAWLTCRKRALKALHNVLGASQYNARAGTFTGGANAVFWVDIIGERPGGNTIISNITERAKNKVPTTQAAVETELLFPLLRGASVQRWNASPKGNIILTHEEGKRLNAITETKMQSSYPKTFSYLKKFEPMLRKRAAFKRYFKENAPFYSIFNIGDYTFAQWKVVWREVANELDAAVIGKGTVGDEQKPVVPDHTNILVECDTAEEAHFFCAAINSSPARLAIRNYIVLHPDPHVLNNINIPNFSKSNRTHARLAELSEAAHKAAAKGATVEVKKIEEEVDKAVARLWGLSDDDLAEIKRSLEEI
jgi:methylase of polypeptide subunit release factors